jgi:hypothetical protein
MSNSHSVVGQSLGLCKPCKGSRMEVRASDPDYVAKSIECNDLFTRLAVGVSYSTIVAEHIRNNHTKLNELWITPEYYSTSTQRHIGYFRSGFLKANPNHSADNIFVTNAKNYLSGKTREYSYFAKVAMEVTNAALPDVDKPRLRTSTRRGTIVSCINRLDLARRNMTKGIPLNAVHDDTFMDLMATTHFLEMLQETPDIDEVRAAVRAHLALNNPRNA